MRADDVARWARDALAPAAAEVRTVQPIVEARTNDFGTWLTVELRTRFTSVRIGVVVKDEVTANRIRLLAFQLADRAAAAGVTTFGLHPDGELRFAQDLGEGRSPA